MNEYLRNLNRIEFVVTSACTGKCKHCSQGDHRGTENINKAYAADAVYKIANEYNIKSVMTFGGEALLYPETVCEIHRAAKEMNIPKRQLITNGFFTNDYEKIYQIGQTLIENGVNEILISADAFHQETIPLEYVISFAKAVNHSDITLKNAILQNVNFTVCNNNNNNNNNDDDDDDDGDDDGDDDDND